MTLDIIEQTLDGLTVPSEQDQILTTLGILQTPASGTKWIIKRAFSNLLFGPATRTGKTASHGIYVVRQPGPAFVAKGIKTGDGYWLCRNKNALSTVTSDTGAHSSTGGPTDGGTGPEGHTVYSSSVEVYPGEVLILRLVAFDGDTGVASVTIDIKSIDTTLSIAIPAQSANIVAPAQSVPVTTADAKVSVTVDVPPQPSTVSTPAQNVIVQIPAQIVQVTV